VEDNEGPMSFVEDDDGDCETTVDGVDEALLSTAEVEAEADGGMGVLT